MSSRLPHRENPDDSSVPGPVFRGPSSHRPPIPRYQVVLHYAADNGLLLVVRVLRELTRFGEAEAMSRMWEACHRGRAMVLVTHKERAELYVEQFADRGLTATIEPAG